MVVTGATQNMKRTNSSDNRADQVSSQLWGYITRQNIEKHRFQLINDAVLKFSKCYDTSLCGSFQNLEETPSENY
jgi:hypothetical protein